MTNEREAIIATAWATIIAVAISALAMVTSCTQNKRIMQQAQSQFTDNFREQQRQFDEERRRWEKEQAEGAKKDAIHEAQISEQLKLMQQANLTQQAQNLDARRIAKENLDEWKKQWEVERKEQTRPYLSTHQCCNPVAVLIASSTEAQTFPPIRLPEADDEKSLFKKSNHNVGYAVTVKNLGIGSAAEIEARWVVERITNLDGTSGLNIEIPPGVRYDAIPNHVKSGDECQVKYLPFCIHNDDERKIQRVDGYLELSCKDINGNPYSFKYRFWAMPYESKDEKERQKRMAYVHLHVEEHHREAIEPITESQRTPDQVLQIPASTPMPTSK